MDAVKFLKEAIRMCESSTGCTGCVLEQENAIMPCNCLTTSMETEEPDKLVSIIEKWSKEHLIKTRQDMIIKEFPNIEMIGDFIDLRPCDMDPEINCPDGTNGCTECKKRYWLTEVE